MATKVMRILITARDAAALSALLREHLLDMSCGGPRKDRSGIVRVEAYVPEDRIERLKRDGVTIDIIEDATAAVRARQQEVGKGNRFEGENRVPRGLGRKIKDGGHVP